jgi:hypothetical protein
MSVVLRLVHIIGGRFVELPAVAVSLRLALARRGNHGDNTSLQRPLPDVQPAMQDAVALGLDVERDKVAFVAVDEVSATHLGPVVEVPLGNMSRAPPESQCRDDNVSRHRALLVGALRRASL